MQCQLCKKHATVHLTEIINGQKIERHLCEECAQKEGIAVKTHISLNELIDNLVTSQQETEGLSDLRCPQCNMSWGMFRKDGLLGCPNDYYAFEDNSFGVSLGDASGTDCPRLCWYGMW